MLLVHSLQFLPKQPTMLQFMATSIMLFYILTSDARPSLHNKLHVDLNCKAEGREFVLDSSNWILVEKGGRVDDTNRAESQCTINGPVSSESDGDDLQMTHILWTSNFPLNYDGQISFDGKTLKCSINHSSNERYGSHIPPMVPDSGLTYSCIAKKSSKAANFKLEVSQEEVNCVGTSRIGDLPKKLLGEACHGAGKWMYNANGAFVCSKCCADFHWSNSAKKCQPCGKKYTSYEPSAFVHACNKPRKTPTTSSLPPLLTEHETSTTPETFPTRFLTSSVLVVTNPENNFCLVRQDWTRSSSRSPNSLLFDRCGNAGTVSWSEPKVFRTLNLVPPKGKVKVQIVVNLLNVSVSWTLPVIQENENPLLGIKASYQQVNSVNGTSKVPAEHMTDKSLWFTVQEPGQYELHICTYNEAGNGPLVNETFHVAAEGNQSGVGLTNVIGILVGVFIVVVIVAVLLCLRKGNHGQYRSGRTAHRQTQSASTPHNDET